MLLRSITSKQAYHHSRRHQAEYPFAQRIAQSGAHQQDYSAFQFAQSIGGAAAIKDPERNQIERVEPCAGSCQSGPQSIARLVPQQIANSRLQARQHMALPG